MGTMKKGKSRIWDIEKGRISEEQKQELIRGYIRISKERLKRGEQGSIQPLILHSKVGV